ncbi:MAG: PrsW family glutamic-type intramembrane protease [Verrucomicrobiota bacterium]
MTPFRRRLHMFSRNPVMLTRAVLVILGLSALIAAGLNAEGSPEEWAKHWKGLTENAGPGGGDKIATLLKADPVDRTALVRALRRDARVAGTAGDAAAGGGDEPDGPEDAGETENAAELLAKSALPEPERALFLKYHETLQAKNPDAAAAAAVLEAGRVNGSEALPLTMAADVLRKGHDFPGALKLYEKAAALPDGVEARRRALDLALVRDWPDVTDRLLAADGYREALDSVDDGLPMRVAQYTGDAGALLAVSAAHVAQSARNNGLFLISLLTAAVWFVSLHKACRIPLREWWISLLGVLLGVGSVVVTLLFLMLQESRGGLMENGTADNDFIFYIAGVGLREEAAKLICFLPLLPLLRRRTPGLALVAASCVGLGFALEENLSYYQSGGAGAALARFVTANFMHLAMTGLLGYSLFRFLRYPKNYGPAFLAVFAAMVVVHGFYDFCLSGYSKDAASLPMYVLAGLAYFYFQTVRSEQDGAPQVLSAHSVFLLGSAVLVGSLLNYLVADLGWHLSLIILWPALLSIILLNALFVWFLREL